MAVSLPNVRHHSVVLPLVVQGRWDYDDAGVLDRTHLRFFTRTGMLDFLDRCRAAAADHAPPGAHAADTGAAAAGRPG